MRKALESVPGVRTVEIDFDKKEARVAFEDSKASVELLVASLDKDGFGGTFKSEGK